MAVRLLVKQRSEAGGADKSTEVLLEEETITLGREKTCHVVLAQQAVSRSHARISKDGPLFFIEDLGSAYGTQINGQKLPRGEKRLLRNGDVIAIAQFDVTFERISDALRNAPEGNTSMVARAAMKDLMRAGQGEQPTFRIMNGPREGQRFEIPDAKELLIGREDDVDIVLKDDLVSRRHAKVRRDWSGTHVEDLGSRNGVKVNRKRITRRTLKDRDELEVGGIRLLYIDPTAVPEEPLALHPGGESTSHEPDDAEVLPNGTAAPVKAPPPAPEPAEEDEGDEASQASQTAAPPQGAGDDEEDNETAESPSDDEEPPQDEQEEVSTAAPPPSAAPREKLDLRSPKALVQLVTLGLVAIVAIGLIIALFAGA